MVATVVMLVGIFVALYEFRQTASVPNDRNAGLESGREPQETRSLTGRRPPPDKRTAARLLELERLKKRWVEIQDQAKGHFVSPEIQALAKESVESLLCSGELLRLLEFLDSRGMGSATYAIRESVPDLFVSDLAPEARRVLADLSHKASRYIQGSLENWSYHAGRLCSKEDFDAFRGSLGNEECALSASLGWNVQHAKSDPVGAMTSTLQLLESDVRSSMQHQILLRLVDNIPPEANMAEIEALLPPLNSNRSNGTIEEGRSRLLVKWAKLDPAGAANYAMAHPERVDPEAIRLITHTVLETNYRGGLEWIEHFPEGPYLDAAAQAAVEMASRSSPEVATRYASMIQNEELRQKCIKEIQDAEARRLLPLEMEK